MSFTENLASAEGLYKNVKNIGGVKPESFRQLENCKTALIACLAALKTNPAWLTDQMFEALTAIPLDGPIYQFNPNVDSHKAMPVEELALFVTQALSGLENIAADKNKVIASLNKIITAAPNFSVRQAAMWELSAFVDAPEDALTQSALALLEKQAAENDDSAIRVRTRQCLHFIGAERCPGIIDVALRALANGTRDRDEKASKEAYFELIDIVETVPFLKEPHFDTLLATFNQGIAREVADLKSLAIAGRSRTMQQWANSGQAVHHPSPDKPRPTP